MRQEKSIGNISIPEKSSHLIQSLHRKVVTFEQKMMTCYGSVLKSYKTYCRYCLQRKKKIVLLSFVSCFLNAQFISVLINDMK